MSWNPGERYWAKPEEMSYDDVDNLRKKYELEEQITAALIGIAASIMGGILYTSVKGVVGTAISLGGVTYALSDYLTRHDDVLEEALKENRKADTFIVRIRYICLGSPQKPRVEIDKYELDPVY